MKKKNLSMLLAGAMTVGMIGSASAVTPAAEIGSSHTIQENGGTDQTGSADVELVGKVSNEAVLLSVVVPTRIDFIVATKPAENGQVIADRKGAGANAMSGGDYFVFNGLISGTGTVTNNSNVPVKLQLTGVQDAGGLTDLMDLALTSDSLSAVDALQNPLEHKDYTAAPITLVNSIAIGGGTAELKVVGDGAQGTVTGGGLGDVHLPNDDYTIKTTLKVSYADNVSGT